MMANLERLWEQFSLTKDEATRVELNVDGGFEAVVCNSNDNVLDIVSIKENSLNVAKRKVCAISMDISDDDNKQDFSVKKLIMVDGCALDSKKTRCLLGHTTKSHENLNLEPPRHGGHRHGPFHFEAMWTKHGEVKKLPVRPCHTQNWLKQLMKELDEVLANDDQMLVSIIVKS
ncbi:hypothetical protein GH714_032000 [Hevea brasiliensis]|uniref:Uncharacterized protein n=1 Tax=Hevea brasiliensis TaxID=3981 RepID=A0A6A6K7W4_HEVBR|nr:hypothetical protein GH714_032000 [Hevea brasiliensis]